MHDIEKNMIYKYLSRCYPTHRIKDGNRFKKAIFINGDKYLLRDKHNTEMLFIKLSDIIITVFDHPAKNTKKIVTDFLNIKN